MIEQTPPQSIESEMAVLGAMMMDINAIHIAMGIIKPDYFYRDAHQKVYQTIIFLYEKNEPMDIVTVSEQLQRDNKLSSVGGAVYLTTLLNSVPTSANIKYYATIVKDKALLRKLITASVNIATMGYECDDDVSTVLGDAEQMIFDIVLQNNTEKDYVTTKNYMHTHIEEIEQRCLHGGLAGLSTGYYDLDYLLGGLQPQQVIVVAAGTSMGKSCLTSNIAVNLAKQGHAVGIIALESSQKKTLDRLIAIEGKVDTMRIARGQLTANEWDRIMLTSREYSETHAPICVTMADYLDVAGITSIAMGMQRKEKIELLIIDHIGLIVPSKEHSREREIAVITRKLRYLAKRMNIPIIEISQLSRELRGRADKRPILSDLKDSSSIEHDADVVMFVYRDNYYNPESAAGNITEVLVRKNRDGKTGMAEVLFQPEFTKFVNLSGEEYE